MKRHGRSQLAPAVSCTIVSVIVKLAYLAVLNREPSNADTDLALTYLKSAKERFTQLSELDDWESLCRVLMASNEFIYVN